MSVPRASFATATDQGRTDLDRYAVHFHSSCVTPPARAAYGAAAFGESFEGRFRGEAPPDPAESSAARWFPRMHIMHAQILPLVMVATILQLPALAEPAARNELEPACAQDPAANPKAEYEKRKKEAEGSVEKLWKLYDWCEASGLKNESRSTLRSILKLDPDEKQAHELLGHVFFDGKWFDSDKKVDEYKKKQLEAEAKASGKVVYKGALVDPADVPFLEKGMTKD